MSLHLYDKALKEKLLEVFDNVVDASEDKALQLSEDGQALVHLPLISFWRINNNLSTDYAQFPLKDRGRSCSKVIGDSRLINYEVSFNLEYQIDIWSDRRSECDDLFTELLLFFMQEASLSIYDPNEEINYTFPIQITETNTNVELSEFNEKGNLYRQVITLTIPNATVFFPKKRNVAKVRELKVILEDYRGNTYDL